MSDEQRDTIRSLPGPLLDDRPPAPKGFFHSWSWIGSHLACALADWEPGRDNALVQLKSEPLELLGDFATSGGQVPLLVLDVNEGFGWGRDNEFLTSPGSFTRSKSCRLWGSICVTNCHKWWFFFICMLLPKGRIIAKEKDELSLTWNSVTTPALLYWGFL